MSGDERYPVTWSATEGIAWRADLPGPGNSSPIVFRDRVYLTQALDSGRVRSLLCFDAKSGKLLWRKDAEYGKADPTHKTNPWCAASPVTDGERIYAWLGNAGLFAYSPDGREIWKADLGSDFSHQWGPNAASPVVAGDLIIVHSGPGMKVGLLGIDRKTGKVVWENPLAGAESDTFKQFKGSWATPLLIRNGNRAELLVGLPDILASFDPRTGKEWWRCGGLGDLCYTNALADEKRVVYLGGFGGPGMGVRLPEPSETGDVTGSHRLWADPPKGKNNNPQRIGSGQMVDGRVYLLNATGLMQCLDAATGQVRWQEKLSRPSWSSMNLAGGKFYVNDQAGTTYVMEPDPEKLVLVSTNPLDPNLHTNASPAFANGRIYLRTDSVLYCIGD